MIGKREIFNIFSTWWYIIIFYLSKQSHFINIKGNVKSKASTILMDLWTQLWFKAISGHNWRIGISVLIFENLTFTYRSISSGSSTGYPTQVSSNPNILGTNFGTTNLTEIKYWDNPRKDWNFALLENRETRVSTPLWFVWLCSIL